MSRSEATERFAAEEFTTPPTVDKAYNFGRRSAYAGHGRMNHEQFFRNDPHPRPYGTSGLYLAYRKGFQLGREQRANAVSEERARR